MIVKTWVLVILYFYSGAFHIVSIPTKDKNICEDMVKQLSTIDEILNSECYEVTEKKDVEI